MTGQNTATATVAPARGAFVPQNDFEACRDRKSLYAHLRMSGMTDEQIARVALFRFGLGPRRGDAADLNQYDTRNGGLKAINQCFYELQTDNHIIKNVPAWLSDDNCWRSAMGGPLSGEIRYQELGLRYSQSMKPKVGFAERLVLFWANHFSIAMEKSVPVRGVLGLFERSVIRPNIKGRFNDMLQAAIENVAMLAFLDNDKSAKDAVNQNLGREILELHTLGAGSTAYQESDVIALSHMLTGWNVNYDIYQIMTNGAVARKPDGTKDSQHGAKYGRFKFDPSKHDETAQTMCSWTFAGKGQAKAKSALRSLAAHPDTAEHLAFKLIQHFVKDNPDQTMVENLQSVYLANSGSLYKLTTALLLTPAAWKEPMKRLRPPHLWLVSQARAMGCDDNDFVALVPRATFNPRRMVSKTNQKWDYALEGYWSNRLGWLNHAPWSRGTPDGFPDQDSEWLDPDAMRIRLMLPCTLMNDFYSRRQKYPAPYSFATLPSAAEIAGACYLTVSDPNAPGGYVPPSEKDPDRLTRKQLADLFLSSDFMCR